MSERFRVTFQHYPTALPSSRFQATLEENDVAPGDGEDCWGNVGSWCAASNGEALTLLKAYYVREHEERMRAIEAAR